MVLSSYSISLNTSVFFLSSIASFTNFITSLYSLRRFQSIPYFSYAWVTIEAPSAARSLKRLKSSSEPLVITQRGRAAAVLLSLDAYERSEHERELLRLLARGEQEISEGKGYALDDVLKEAYSLLADEKP